MKKILALVLVVLMAVAAVSLVGCGVNAEEDLDNVLAKGKLVVGMEVAYAPYNWATNTANEYTAPVSNGTYADGYDVQIAKLIAAELGVELEIKAVEWDGLIPALQSGDIDLVIAGMSPTDERKLTIDISNTYFDSNLVMVVRKDGNYTNATSIQDFSGAKITGQLNTFHYDVIDQIQGVNKQVALQDFSALIISLQSKAIDGYVCERPGAISAVAANSDFTYIEFDAENGFVCDPAESSISVGLRKNSTLTQKVNEAIAKLTTAQKNQMMDDAIARQPVAN